MILHANRQKVISSTTATAAAETSITLNTEQSVVLFNLDVTSIGTGVSFVVEVYASNGTTERLLHREIVTKITSEPKEFAAQSGLDFVVKIFYTGAVTYSLNGKSLVSLPISSSAVVNNEDPAPAEDNTAEWRQNIETLLKTNNDLMLRMLNHLRYMTNIESEQGEDY